MCWNRHPSLSFQIESVPYVNLKQHMEKVIDRQLMIQLFRGRKYEMGNTLLNLRYLLAPVLIIVAGAGVLIGGVMAWLGVVLLFVGLLVDIAT